MNLTKNTDTLHSSEQENERKIDNKMRSRDNIHDGLNYMISRIYDAYPTHMEIWASDMNADRLISDVNKKFIYSVLTGTSKDLVDEGITEKDVYHLGYTSANLYKKSDYWEHVSDDGFKRAILDEKGVEVIIVITVDPKEIELLITEKKQHRKEQINEQSNINRTPDTRSGNFNTHQRR